MHTHSFVQDAEVTVHVRIIVFLPIKQGAQCHQSIYSLSQRMMSLAPSLAGGPLYREEQLSLSAVQIYRATVFIFYSEGHEGGREKELGRKRKMERWREWKWWRAFTDKSRRLTSHYLKKTLLAISRIGSIRYQSVCMCVPLLDAVCCHHWQTHKSLGKTLQSRGL